MDTAYPGVRTADTVVQFVQFVHIAVLYKLRCCLGRYLDHLWFVRRSQWPRGLGRRSATTRLLRSWVRIPPGAWTFVRCVVLSGRGLCDELITRPEEYCRLGCVVVCDLETSRMRRQWPALCRKVHKKKIMIYTLAGLTPANDDGCVTPRQKKKVSSLALCEPG